MNHPINSLIGGPSLAAAGVSGNGLPGTGGGAGPGPGPGGGGAAAQMMAAMHPTGTGIVGTSFDVNMASSVTLACCQSLCDVLTELPLPTAVTDKSTNTRSLITGLNLGSRNGLLNEHGNIDPHLQQALYLAKQQLDSVTFITGGPSSSSYPSQSSTTVSPSTNSDGPPSQPSPLLHELLRRGCFLNSQPPSASTTPVASATTPSPSGSSIYQSQPQQQTSHSSSSSIANNNSASSNSATTNNLNDLTADLHTIEPSIDRHMTDLHQNLMNDLINDDCDMSSSIHSNATGGGPGELSSSATYPGHPEQNHSSSSSSSSSVLSTAATHHHQHSHQQQQQQLHHQNNNMLNNDYSQMNHCSRTATMAGNAVSGLPQHHQDIKMEPDSNNINNYSSLGERVKSRQREAAQKANQAVASTAAAYSSPAAAAAHQQQPQLPPPPPPYSQSVPNSNNSQTIDHQHHPAADATMHHHHQNFNSTRIKNEYNSQQQEDKDWQLPGASSMRRTTTKTGPLPSTPTTATTATPAYKKPAYRRPVIETKPAIRSVKYSFSDTDYSDSSLLNSTVDIVVRFEQIIDDILSNSCNDFNEYGDASDNDEYYESNMDQRGRSSASSSSKKKRMKSSAYDSNHVNGMSFNVSVDAEQLKEIMILSAKLKQTNRVMEIERKKLILFLTVLSNQLNIWFTRYKSKSNTVQNHDDAGDDYDDSAAERAHYWELCCNASQSALHIMTSSGPNHDKASLISLEELIEVIVDFLSNNLSAATHVSTTVSAKSPGKSKAQQHNHHHLGVSKRHVSRWTQLLQLLFEFINLRTKGSLTDTLILSLTRISMSALFLLQNTAEMQFVSIEILCHVFEEYQKHRISILEELLNSLAKIPTKKSHRKDSVLTQMLVRLTNAFYQPDTNRSQTRESLEAQGTAALKIISGFLSHFLRKCHQSSSNSDVDFRIIFESLLNDLLDSFYSPHSTASILIVQIIIKLLISYLSPNQAKSQSSSLAARLLAIEYLSIICSKFAQSLAEKDDITKELVKTFSTIEEVEKPSGKNKNKQNNNNSNNPETQQFVTKIWTYLNNYFNSEKLLREKLALASVWVKEKYFSEDEQRLGQFLAKLNNHKVNDDTSVIDISTAALCIQYMEFVHFSTNSRLFDISISHVTASLSNTSNTTQRSRAMKCLSNILSSTTIDRATQLLSRNDLQNAMRSALLDPSTSVREATVDLIGRFVLQSKDQTLCQRYSDLIGDRILDTGISVRKRVIKILRDFCIEFPEYEKCGEMAVKIVRRINDDGEGIRRLVVDTCRDLWFTHSNSAPIKYKVYSLLHVIANMINDNASMESMQSLFDQLIKTDTMPIAQQICDSIMNDVLIDDMPQSTKVTQLSAVQCISMMSQCCPELVVKHCDTLQSLMSLSCETMLEIQLRMRLIQTIERVLPHINNPPPSLLTRLEEDLTKNILQSTPIIIQSSIKCLSILIRNHTKNSKLAVELFCKFQQILYQYRNMLYDPNHNEQQVKPKLLRAIFTCGLFAKYFSSHICEYKDRVRDTFIDLIQTQNDVDIKCKSITGLGFIIESDPKICLLPAVIEIYTRILRKENSESRDLQANKNEESYCIQVLNNFRNYLSESIEYDENAVKTIEWARESLKSMQSSEEDSSSTQSQIIQKYLSSILINALNPNLAIRRVACNVIHVIHSGGHVHPLQLVPHLVAMTCDDDHQIRVRADHVLHDIERKYHGFVAMKAKDAVHLSALFCKKLRCAGYRVYMEKTPANNNDSQNLISMPASHREICARLSILYHVICTNRQSRRAFITSLLRHLDASEIASNKQDQLIDIEFVVENVLFFPYTVYDEILYILNQLECTSSINSTHVTQLFKEILILEPLNQQQQSGLENQYPPAQQNPMMMNQPNTTIMYDQAGNMIYHQNPYDPNVQHQQQMYQQQHNPMYHQNSNVPPPPPPMMMMMDNVDLEEIDWENEEQKKRYENRIRVNFELLLSDNTNERLANLVRSLRTIYLSTLLRTLLKEFFLLKDEKINDYSTNDSKAWEKPVHRRQIDSSLLKELFSMAKPNIDVPESLLMSDNLDLIGQQLFDEWKRFKQASLNNCDPNFKSAILTKIFQGQKSQQSMMAPQPVTTNTGQAQQPEQQMNNEMSGYVQTPPVENDHSAIRARMPSGGQNTPGSAKKNSKKSKQKKKRRRVIINDDDESESESFDDDDDDEDYHQ